MISNTNPFNSHSLNPYKVNHLFLLMGENPLPNAVAAITLLHPNGIPYLIHTTYTQTQAERLAAVLQNHPSLKPAQLINLGNNQAEAYVIRQRIQAIAQSLQGKVGMNYTGGTKVMSVHAYRAIAEVYPDAVFSYLDSNTLELMIDQDQQPSLRLKVTPSFSLEQLFRLHNLTWRTDHPPLTAPLQPEAATKLAHLHQYPELAQAWRGWCNRHLRRAAKNEFFRWRSEPELARISPLPLTELPDIFLTEVLQPHLGTQSASLSLAIAQKQGFRDLTQVCEWLDGTWLEHYVLLQIQRIASQCQIHDSRLSFRIPDPRRPPRPDDSPLWDKFEFDVAFMHHYQLFALSCTTTEKRSLCKQKLMEASVRARQLGGAEARVGLVCCYHNPESLRSELEVATRNKKIAVFGLQDLRNLGQKIASWVQQNG